jgi:hypothetical protein
VERSESTGPVGVQGTEEAGGAKVRVYLARPPPWLRGLDAGRSADYLMPHRLGRSPALQSILDAFGSLTFCEHTTTLRFVESNSQAIVWVPTDVWATPIGVYTDRSSEFGCDDAWVV